MNDPGNRTDPPDVADELPTLLGFLQWQRDTTAWKTRGLGETQLRARPLSSTSLSLLGLVRHLAEVEHGWTRQRVEGQPVASIWCTEDRPEADFEDVDTADVAEAFDTWRRECRHTDEVLSERSLGSTFSYRGQSGETTLSIRWLLAHLIEEYARHNGHADLLREAIDGETGE